VVTRFLLDTNTISHIARNRSPSARKRLESYQDAGPVYLSVISEGEILYGLAKRPDAHQVAHFMHATLAGLRTLPWTSEAAIAYGLLRARNEALGISLGALDMLIAAHALAEDAVLVTGDAAFARLIGGPRTENWADDIRPN
jgi:tRNA(fMet)-specific endonuclease VapC